jgi:hypothetical protein
MNIENYLYATCKKKDSEIERLKRELKHLAFGYAGEREDHKALLTRAADALDRPETRAFRYYWVENLIRELRNATK